jgi:hypothetical protein
MRSRWLLWMAMVMVGLLVPGCIQETDPETECDDAKDNDLDGLWDCNDPDCAGVAGCPGDGDDDDATGDDDDTTGDDDDATGDDDTTGDDDDDATGDDDVTGDDDDSAGDDDDDVTADDDSAQ